MRPQHNNNNNNNKNRNRNRNRRHTSSGGGGNQGGGSGANRVYDSNGPDVKLRGTAQTIAEKYMQLGRDAQSSGDIVMAESYYQFGDHYYRIWLAAQPVGQPLQFSRRMAEDEYDDEGNEQPNDADGNDGGDGEGPEAAGGETEAAEGAPEGDGQPQGFQPRNNRDYNNNRDNRDNRDGGNNRNFKPRWPRRNERYNQDSQPNVTPADAQGEQGERPERQERSDRNERQDRVQHEERIAAVVVQDAPEASNWEAPSFLTRPTPVLASEAVETAAADAPAPRRRGRPPKVHAAPVEDVPQGE